MPAGSRVGVGFLRGPPPPPPPPGGTPTAAQSQPRQPAALCASCETLRPPCQPSALLSQWLSQPLTLDSSTLPAPLPTHSPSHPPSTSILKPSRRGTVTTPALFTAASNTYLWTTEGGGGGGPNQTKNDGQIKQGGWGGRWEWQVAGVAGASGVSQGDRGRCKGLPSVPSLLRCVHPHGEGGRAVDNLVALVQHAAHQQVNQLVCAAANLEVTRKRWL